MKIAVLSLITVITANLVAAEHVREVVIDGMIHPVTTDIVSSAVARASQAGDALLIIRLDTPGGLSAAMRDTISKIEDSRVPVVVYVGPRGARAASAGFFLLESADLAAMSPGTNTGAAHPVLLGSQMDPVMKEKLENDAAASLRSMTAQRGRNVALAESAVLQSHSFTEHEALDGHLIEIIAADEADLLHQLSGRTIKRFNGASTTLHVEGASIVRHELTVRQWLLSSLSDPNLALILFALGVLGVYVEFAAPGLIFPGVIGAMLFVLGLAALSVLPFNWLGATLMLLGLGMFALELKLTSHGILSVGGAAALVLGATMLVDSPFPEMRIHLVTALGVAAPLAIITTMLLTLAMRARRNKVVTGAEGMIHELGITLEDLALDGRVLVHGENWQAQSDRVIGRGTPVRVREISRLLLRVEPIEAHEEGKR